MLTSGFLAAVFDGSYEGFLTIIYQHYYEKLNPDYIVEEDKYQQTLDTEYLFVAGDFVKAERVIKGIRTKVSEASAEYVYRAFLNAEENKYMVLYRYILFGFRVGKDLDRYEQNDDVLKVHKLAKYVNHEAHSFLGFTRFAETEQGIYYAKISPVNHIMPVVAEFFADRFMNHPWIIHDVKRGIAAIYDGKSYIIAETPRQANVVYSDVEESYQAMWKKFHDTIAIKERKNAKLQQQLMPKRIRKHVVEWMNLK